MKNFKQYTWAIGFFIMLISCNKQDRLNPVPENSISDASAFDVPYRIKNQVLSLYGDLKNGGLYGGRLLNYGDIRGEDFLMEDPNLVTNADVWAYNPTNTANGVVGLWQFGYRAINNCNLFLDGMEAKGKTIVDATTGNQYIAEARFIRALCYYNMLQFYARPYADGNGEKPGLPLRLVGIKGSGYSNLARSSVAEIYKQILDDLNFAEQNLPAKYNDALTNTTRAHKNTVIAIKTRVYLSMNKYGDVITEANKIVPAAAPFTATSGMANTLVSDIVSVFKTPYTTAESILSMPFTSTAGDIPGTQNGLQAYYFASATGGGSVYSLNTAGILGNTSWKATDARKTFVFEATSGKKYLKKFPTASPADYTPVIRWAEVLLNLAEAKVRNSNTVDAQAIAILNAIRQRSDATTSFTAGDFANPASLLTAIMTERRIEFLGEGLRNNDLMRLLQPLPTKGTITTPINPSDDVYIWPASATELSLNKLWK